MNPAPPLSWGLIGASNIAARWVLPALRAGGDSVEFVYSSAAAWAAEFAAANGIAHSTDDFGRACGWPGVDAVFISGINERHAPQTIAMAAAGKHVLCEKPMALTVADGRRMIDAAERHGVVLAINHHLPGAETLRTIQRLVSSGSLGVPLAVRLGFTIMISERPPAWRLHDPVGGGAILDLTTHSVSVAQAVLGTTATAAAAIAVRQGPWAAPGDGGPPDAVMAALRFDDVPVQTHDAYTVTHRPTSVEVIGTEASVRGVGVLAQEPAGTLWRTANGETNEIEVPGRRDLYEIVADGFRAAIAGTGHPTVDGAAGLSALAGALAVAESAKTGRTVQVAAVA
ncbi:MAG: Gfo/Idh/MocA family oxidoreductase [bacterium]|nr:Gfo/Idh/MocA family oxidoreductase [bacterium]MCY3952356.1 Gfo/Idh/MocA family oxidoreductase [bacterium]MCY4103095.1 Gfo/Idh/MocA family oxidoreductase [bacterium]